MKSFGLMLGTIVALLAGAAAHAAVLAPPAFHHLMLNSVNPNAAIAFYIKAFPDSRKTRWAGYPALAAPNNVLILFNKVSAPPPSNSLETAFWHFGWTTLDQRKKVGTLQVQGFEFAPLYTGVGNKTVVISSDTFPGNGRTKQQITEALDEHIAPPGGPGVSYLKGPDKALIEVSGNSDQERFNHLHMWQEQPFCALVWYEKHLNAVPAPGVEAFQHTEANCRTLHSEATWPSLTRNGEYRYPMIGEGVLFSGVSLKWYVNQTGKPLVSSRNHLMDHVGLSVSDLDAWIAKLQKENVTILRHPYKLGNTRAVMIEGPSREAIELIEVK